MRHMLRSALRQYRRFWISSLFLLLGTATAIMAVTFVLGSALDQAARRIEIASPDRARRADMLIMGQEQPPRQLYEVIRGLPGISAITMDTEYWITPRPPLERSAKVISMEISGEVWHPPVLEGQFLTATDTKTGAEPVVVVGATLARVWFGKGSAVGRVIDLPMGGEIRSFRVIGVIGVAGRITDWDEAVIISGSNDTGRKVNEFQITSASTGVLHEVKQAVQTALRSSLPGVKDIAEVRREPPVSDEPAIVASLSVLSLLILVVAGVNSANLAVFWVLRRRREMAIRQAVGATRGAVIRMVLGEILILNLAGVGLALLGYGAIRRLEVTPLPLAFSWVHVAVGVTAAVLSGLLVGIAPALRAARMDPVDVLRTE